MCSIQTSKFGKSASFLQHSTGLWVLLIQRGRYHDNSACSPQTTCSLILFTHTWGILVPLLPEIPSCLSGIPSPLDSQEPVTHLIDRDQWALKWQQEQMSKTLHSLVELTVWCPSLLNAGHVRGSVHFCTSAARFRALNHPHSHPLPSCCTEKWLSTKSKTWIWNNSEVQHWVLVSAAAASAQGSATISTC